jgi:putative oxidoreductase
VLAARLLIGTIFVYASIYKILDPADFAVAIRNYLILPSQFSIIAALTLPWVEFVAGIFLIVGIQTKPSALLITGMMATFLSAVIYAYSTGLDIDCGCFGSAAYSEGRVGILHVLRDATLFLVSLAIVILDQGHFSVEEKFTSIWKKRVTSAS